jgi:hypothetical protein
MVVANLLKDRCGVRILALGLLGQIVAVEAAWPQAMQQQSMPPSSSQSPTSQSPPASLAPQPPPSMPTDAASPSGSSRPGLIDKLGGWLKDSADGVASGLKGTQQQIDSINKGTVDALTRIPVTGFATGRVACPMTANGAPDCYAASSKLCQDKGYASGKSLATEAAETCNPRIYLPGYKRKDGDCRIDTFVTRAACQ